jgi:hypothetical protein
MEVFMKRYVYAFDSVSSVQSAIKALRRAKVSENRISLIARPDIQSESISPDYLDATTDFAPAVARGAAIGTATGLVIGIVAMAIPASGIEAGIFPLFAFLAGGAILGAWSSAMIGSSVPDAIRRKFEDEIEAGRILLVVDGNRAPRPGIRQALFSVSDRHLVWQTEVNMRK